MNRIFFIFFNLIFLPYVLCKDIATVQVTEIKTQDLFDRYFYPVLLQSKKESQIYAETVGIIKEVKVKIGQAVAAGETLLTMQNSEPHFSQVPFNIKTPIHGTVAAIMKRQGARVQQGDPLIHIINDQEIDMTFEIPSAELTILPQGTKGEVEFRIIETKIPISISGVSPLVKPLTGTASANLEFAEDSISKDLKNNMREKLYPGMLGQAEFKINLRKGIAIPKSSVNFEKDKHIVRIVKENKVVKKQVVLGKEIGNEVEITSGLDIGDKLIISRNKYLKEDEEVKIQ